MGPADWGTRISREMAHSPSCMKGSGAGGEVPKLSVELGAVPTQPNRNTRPELALGNTNVAETDVPIVSKRTPRPREAHEAGGKSGCNQPALTRVGGHRLSAS